MDGGVHPQRRSRWPRTHALVAALLLSAVLVAGCGGSSGGSAAATVDSRSTSRSSTATRTRSNSSGSASPEERRQSELLQFSRCMRSRGVLDFPDLSVTEGVLNVLSHSRVDTRSPAYRAALHACEQYSEAGLTPAQSAAENAKGLELSQCMRSHGVPNFPDPTTGPIGEQVINLRPAHIDPASPTVQAADRACHGIVPGGK